MPTTRTNFWAEKFEANQKRDERVLRTLADGGWRTEVVWECEIRDIEALAHRLISFLGPPMPDEAAFKVARTAGESPRKSELA